MKHKPIQPKTWREHLRDAALCFCVYYTLNGLVGSGAERLARWLNVSVFIVLAVLVAFLLACIPLALLWRQREDEAERQAREARYAAEDAELFGTGK